MPLKETSSRPQLTSGPQVKYNKLWEAGIFHIPKKNRIASWLAPLPFIPGSLMKYSKPWNMCIPLN